jgi:adenylylsulfate kinase|tara:strand:+ start:361 stop:783 length:423 start_codon:yes stop_codon:yes gene_type:complete
VKILIFGLPGSGKTTLAKPLANLLGAIHINADEVRKHYNDWDFTPEGRIRQAQRMKHLSDGAVLAGKVVVTDFVCPTEETRQSFDADFTVWMDTIKEGRFEDTNKMFQKPLKVDYHVQEWFNDTHAKLMEVVSVWMQRND